MTALDTLRTELTGLIEDADSVTLALPARFFITPVTKDSVVAPTPGTLDAHAASRQGRISIEQDLTISYAHFHYDHPAGTGSYAVELYRLRPQTQTPGPGWLDDPTATLIATCEDDGSAGDFHTTSFTFVSSDLKEVQFGDYLVMQVTSVMTGSASKNAAGFVDIHFGDITLS